MAGSLNQVNLIGNLGKDPELRSFQSGGRVASFSLATSESWKDKTTGEKKEKVQWHNIVVFNDNLVSVIEKYVSKGSKLYVTGALETRKWQDKQGVDRYATEVVLRPYNGQIILLGGKENGGGSQQSYDKKNDDGFGGGFGQPTQSASDELDDSIPF